MATAIFEDMKAFILIATNTSKLSRKSTLSSYGSHIKEDSTIIYDGDNSHIALVETLHLNSEEHPSIETKDLKDEEKPMYPINHYHSLLKRFMRAHKDFLQDYTNLFIFMENEKKTEDLFEITIKLMEMMIDY